MTLTTATAQLLAELKGTYRLSFIVEQTGGGCTALVAPVEGDAVVVLSDGNQGHEMGCYDWPSAALYTREDWENGLDAVKEISVDSVSTVAELVAMVTELLGR